MLCFKNLLVVQLMMPLQIGEPDEFDMMLLLRTPRLEWTEIDELDGVFYKVSLIKPTRENIHDFLLQDGLTISSTKLLEETRRLVCKFIKTYKGQSPVVRLQEAWPYSLINRSLLIPNSNVLVQWTPQILLVYPVWVTIALYLFIHARLSKPSSPRSQK